VLRRTGRGQGLYEWEYAKQLLYTQMVKEKINRSSPEPRSITEAVDRSPRRRTLFLERFIQPRPCCRPSAPSAVVLLIDEVDKSDPEFEAFLLEVLERLPGVDSRARHPPGAAHPLGVR